MPVMNDSTTDEMLPAEENRPPMVSPPAAEGLSEDEQRKRYFDAMMRGETGARLARSAGMAVPRGTSPPTVMPPPQPSPGPSKWVRAYETPSGSEAGMDMANMERAVGNLPIDQAQKAVTAAMQFQAMRGYQRDIEEGKPAAESLARWMPMLISKPGGGNLGGVAQMIRATQPKPQFKFVPGGEGPGAAPASFQAPGQRPVIVPRTALPPGPQGALIKEEVAPGVLAVRAPGATTIHIVKSNGEELSQKDRIALMPRIIAAEKTLSGMDEESPRYQETAGMIEAMKAAAKGRQAPTVPPPAARTTVAPPPAAAPAPAARPTGKTRTFRDSEGNVWRYTGTSANPKADKNPDNWVKEE